MKLTALTSAKSIVLIGFLSFTQQSLSQTQNLVASSPQARNLVETDLNRLVDETFPAYDQTEIEKRLHAAAKELETRPYTIKASSLHSLEALMGLPASGSLNSEITTSKAYYRLDPLLGTAYAQHKDSTLISTSRTDFANMQPVIQSLHRHFLDNLGVPDDEVMKTAFKQVLIQGIDPNSSNTPDPSIARVSRGMSFSYRGFKGFPIEESFIRVSSSTSKRVDDFSLSWPRFYLHPGMKGVSLATKNEIKHYILAALRNRVSPNQELKLNMGLVFRPAQTLGGRLVHFPAMKVIMTPMAQSLPRGTLTEGGQEFYARILKTPPVIKDGGGRDRSDANE